MSEVRNKVRDLLDYIDFESIVWDFDLEGGDLSPLRCHMLETVLEEFIKDNKKTPIV
jgi:hypothetical protein